MLSAETAALFAITGSAGPCSSSRSWIGGGFSFCTPKQAPPTPPCAAVPRRRHRPPPVPELRAAPVRTGPTKPTDGRVAFSGYRLRNDLVMESRLTHELAARRPATWLSPKDGEIPPFLPPPTDTSHEGVCSVR